MMYMCCRDQGSIVLPVNVEVTRVWRCIEASKVNGTGSGFRLDGGVEIRVGNPPLADILDVWLRPCLSAIIQVMKVLGQS